jgi:hypothetical protein
MISYPTRSALKEPQFYNVVMDWHLYNWQAPYTEESRSRHITDALSWAGLIDMYTVQVRPLFSVTFTVTPSISLSLFRSLSPLFYSTRL